MRKLIALALLALVTFSGCQNTGQQAASGGGFNMGNMFGFLGGIAAAGKPEEATAPQNGLLPKEVTEFGIVVRTIVERAQMLNVNDPPEVTRQKAAKILESLQPWDSLVGAAKSVGFLNDQTAATLNVFVTQLRVKTQQLVNYAPEPQTIESVRGLATQLGNIVGSFWPTQPAQAQSAQAQAPTSQVRPSQAARP